MKQYQKMKDSGIEWIGDIPEHWELSKLRYISKIETGDKDTVDNEENGEYPFFVRSQIVEKISTYSYDGEAILTAGDGVGVGKVFHYVNGKFDFHQRVYKISDFVKMIGKYLFYYVQENFHKEVMKLSAKSTVDSLRLPMFLDFPVVFGNENEQKQIAKFLDKQTFKIDSDIQKNQKLIELLKEKRQAVINQAVTKGIVPNVPMKNSGVEWIGKIPKHWYSNDLKWICKKLVVGFVGSTESFHIDEKGIPMLSTTNIQNGKMDLTNLKYVTSSFHNKNKKSQLMENDLIVARHGESGSTALVEGLKEANCLNVVIVRPDMSKMLPKYLQFMMNSHVVKIHLAYEKFGGVQGVVNTEDIGNVPIIFPNDLDEQQLILNYLNKKNIKIDGLLKKTEIQIETLREYRHSLISSAVTGKIDVREAIVA